MAIAINAVAKTSENFNSRKGVSINSLKSNLQSSCWSFHHFDVNNNGWNPRMEGDGAMVSAANAIKYGNSGIYTPMLRVSEELEISFTYRFSENFGEEDERHMRICIADASNHVIQVLEKITFNGSGATFKRKFITTFKNVQPGEYRLLLLYGGHGGNASIAIDELNTSAPSKYPGGCSNPPFAAKQIITGTYNRAAAGDLLADENVNSRFLKTYLIEGSANGIVNLEENGEFTFSPEDDFTGRSTTFVYKICEDGPAGLCSQDAVVMIEFPSGKLVDFNGSYKMDGNVELTWQTTQGSFQKFELERSTDGHRWHSTVTIPAKNSMEESQDYNFLDKVGKDVILKRDLYYRLKQVKSDGSIAVSRLLLLRVYNTKVVSMISVTPDPVISDIGVNLQLHENSMVSMRILSNSGSTVIHKTAEAVDGRNNLLIEGSSKLSPGIYTLEVIVNSKERMLVKLLKE